MVYEVRTSPRHTGIQSRETDGFSQSDRVIRHAVNDLQHAAEEGNFEVETPRVHATQDDLERVTLGWSRWDVSGPLCLKFEFEKEVESDTLYRDISLDMASSTPTVVLYGNTHIWYGIVPHHDIALESHVSGMPLGLNASLMWLEAEPAGWR